MTATIVSDGKERLERALSEKLKLRRAQVLREVESRYEAQLASAGVWHRFLIRLRIRKEVAAILEKEFPSRQALFIR